MVYDIAVQRRNTKLVIDAARSNAIVTQLFPGEIGDKMIGRHNEKKGTSKEETRTLDSQESSMPLAELFLDASIINADITSFDSWSSTRSPDQVFTLLETLFQHFDEIAKRRRIFKVGTLRHCPEMDEMKT